MNTEQFWVVVDGRWSPLRGAATVGRSPECDIVISRSAEASRVHARLTVTSEGVVLEDLNSRNGTFVDGRLLAGPRLLHPDDLVRVGSSQLRIAIGSQEASRDDDWTERTVRLNRRPVELEREARATSGVLQRLSVRAASVRRFDEVKRLNP